MKYTENILRRVMWDFPGDSVARKPPANAGDTGSIPGPGRSHMLQGKLSLRAATTGAHAL